MVAETEKFQIQLIDEERDNWQTLAIELIKQGYKVFLYQDKSKLMVERAWLYSKVDV